MVLAKYKEKMHLLTEAGPEEKGAAQTSEVGAGRAHSNTHTRGRVNLVWAASRWWARRVCSTHISVQ